MSKHRLSFTYEIDFQLIGIVSAVQEYKVAFQLNQLLKLNFKRIEDWEVVFSKKKELQYFKQYYYKDELLKRAFYLIKNKTGGFYCLPEFNIVDYFFIWLGELQDDEMQHFHQQINTLNIVSSAIKINVNDIKNIENILIDEESF